VHHAEERGLCARGGVFCSRMLASGVSCMERWRRRGDVGKSRIGRYRAGYGILSRKDPQDSVSRLDTSTASMPMVSPERREARRRAAWNPFAGTCEVRRRAGEPQRDLTHRPEKERSNGLARAQNAAQASG
jgi:hypothetical protein